MTFGQALFLGMLFVDLRTITSGKETITNNKDMKNLWMKRGIAVMDNKA